MRVFQKLVNIPCFLFNRMTFLLRKICVGKSVVINGMLFIRGKGRIEIGDNVTINSCRAANPIGGDTKTILYAKENSVIQIGNRVGISNSALIAKKEIIIENDVFIGGNCKIYDHDFHSLNYDERIAKTDHGGNAAAVRIKKGAFIGGHTIVLKGVTIGEKSVIGAGAVVAHDIPDGEIWAGNPAKRIGTTQGNGNENQYHE